MADQDGHGQSTGDVEEKFEHKMEAIAAERVEGETASAAAAAGVPYLNLKGFPVSAEAVGLIDEADARRVGAVSFLAHGDEVRVGAVDPAHPGLVELIEALQRKTRGRVGLYQISPASLEWTLKLYRAVPTAAPVSAEVAVTPEDVARGQSAITTLADVASSLEAPTISAQTAALFVASLKFSASDIHLEAEESALVVRFRLDGTLHDVARLPTTVGPKIASRLKLLAGLKINVSNRPQDGHLTIRLPAETVDVRLSTLPTTYGESIVMRILRGSATALTYDQLGLSGRAFELLKHEVHRPNGLVVVTGPTGSGKTTTLYAVLKELAQGETKVITIEDPVEYKLPGISQSQVDPARQYTFASGLRSILRQDPDVIMVGEIRDAETAEIAIQAALTGHLVLSTIHTNDAAGAVPRFLAMGAKPFLLAPALNAALAQRLVRRLCPDCREEVKLPAETLKRVRELLQSIIGITEQPFDLDQLTFQHGRGCQTCHGVGLKGRIGIYEVLVKTPAIEKLIAAGDVPEASIREAAVDGGMVTMAQDGLLKALQGITTVEEVFRVAE